MAQVTFDTLKFVETLEDAGVERRQASAIASAVAQAHEAAAPATVKDLTLALNPQREEMRERLLKADRKADERFAQVQERFAEMHRQVDLRFAEVQERFAEMQHQMDLRFAEAQERAAEARRETDARFAQMQRQIDERFAQMQRQVDERFARMQRQIDERFAEVHVQLAEIKGQFTWMRWMLGIIISGMATILVKLFFG